MQEHAHTNRIQSTVSRLECFSCAKSEPAFRNTYRVTAVSNCHSKRCAGQVEHPAANQRLLSNENRVSRLLHWAFQHEPQPERL